MTLFFHELKRNRLSLAVWTAILSFTLAVSIFVYPEMSSQMTEINDMFSNMGSFSEAFGMSNLNFGEFIGFFGIECGNTLGLGGAFFAAILGVSALSKEERDRTAEFLLTHPISRARIVLEKLLAVIAQILTLNVAVTLISVACAAMIGETGDISTVLLILLSHLLLQIEIASITFGVSAFVNRSVLGIGIGTAAMFYFMNIISNLTEELDFLKYITPFGYTESSDIISNGSLSVKYIAIGALFATVGILLAFLKYRKKDIV